MSVNVIQKRAFSKPQPDFPLFPHATGRWAKKVKGRFVYFGKVADDPEGTAALALWRDQKDDLLAGKLPRTKAEGLRLRELLDRYLVSKRDLVDTGEISGRHFCDLHDTCRRIRDVLGRDRLVADIGPEDFSRLRRAYAKLWGPVRLANEITRTRGPFKFGFEAELIDKPVKFGPEFKGPSKKVLRVHRAQKGKRLFTADQLRTIIEAARVPIKAMILLGVNCGFGNSDCANLPLNAIDLESGWIDYARSKTGIERRVPLWPETVAAIQEAIDQRPKPKSKADASLVFITAGGRAWAKTEFNEPDENGRIKRGVDDLVGNEFSKLIKRLEFHRRGLGFYTLRHVFRTVADDTKDFPAVRSIMGHSDESMDDVYREGIDDARLRAVTDHVRGWLFGADENSFQKTELPT
jgi:integrase